MARFRKLAFDGAALRAGGKLLHKGTKAVGKGAWRGAKTMAGSDVGAAGLLATGGASTVLGVPAAAKRVATSSDVIRSPWKQPLRRY